MQIEITILIAVIGCLIGVSGFFKGMKKDAKDDIHSETKQDVTLAKMDTKLDFIQNDIKDIKAENKILKDDVSQIKGDVVVLKKDVATAHERIDSIKKAGNK